MDRIGINAKSMGKFMQDNELQIFVIIPGNGIFPYTDNRITILIMAASINVQRIAKSSPEEKSGTRSTNDLSEITGLSSLACANLSVICENVPQKINPSDYPERDLSDYIIGKKAKFHFIEFLLEDTALHGKKKDEKDSLLEALSVAAYKYKRYKAKGKIYSWTVDVHQK